MMYNIMEVYQKNPDKFLEEFGTITLFMTNNEIEVFVLEKIDTDSSFGIRIGIDVPDKTTLLANPATFEASLDPTKIEELYNRTIPTGLWKMYIKRDTIRITLTNVNSVKYFTSIDELKITEERSAVSFHNYIRDSETGYRTNGVILTFTVDDEALKKLREDNIDDGTIFSFIRIYLLTWFSCQPSLCSAVE